MLYNVFTMLNADVVVLTVLDDVGKIMINVNNNNNVDVIGFQVSLCYLPVDLLMIVNVNIDHNVSNIDETC